MAEQIDHALDALRIAHDAQLHTIDEMQKMIKTLQYRLEDHKNREHRLYVRMCDVDAENYSERRQYRRTRLGLETVQPD